MYLTLLNLMCSSISLISGHITYPDMRWSRCGRKTEVGLYWDIFALVQTSGNISLIAERDDSGHRTAHAWYQALPLFWYGRLEWWDRKYQDYLLERSHICRDANNRAYSQIIARCIAICSAMLIARISEIFMSTLVKISRFRDLYPANSRKCECPYWVHWPKCIHGSFKQGTLGLALQGQRWHLGQNPWTPAQSGGISYPDKYFDKGGGGGGNMPEFCPNIAHISSDFAKILKFCLNFKLSEIWGHNATHTLPIMPMSTLSKLMDYADYINLPHTDMNRYRNYINSLNIFHMFFISNIHCTYYFNNLDFCKIPENF